MRRFLRPLLIAACFAAAPLAPGLALAAPSAAEVNAARETYREGVALESAGNWAGALSKFREVASVKATPRVRFHIGFCQEKLGRWNEALGAYKMALAEADRENAADVVKEAESARAKLESRIPRITVRKTPGAGSATVSLDGVVLGAAMLGTEMPVDPGPHTIETALPGRPAIRTSIELREGERKTVDAALPDPAEPAPGSSGHAAPTAVPPSATAQATTPSRVLPWLVTGVGAASLAASGVFYVLRQGVISDLEASCGPEFRCSEADRSTYDRGSTYTTIANVTLGVGIVGVGVGTVLLLAGGKQDKTAPGAKGSARTSVGMMIHPSGVSLAGRF